MSVPLARIPTLRALFDEKVLVPEEPSSSRNRNPLSGSILDHVSLYQGDITKLEVDAIVNAANRRLLGGGGVDGSIHAAAGSALLDECRTLNGCETGDAKITQGYNLPANYVVHAVGPIYLESEVEQKAGQLASCYKRSLEIAVRNSLKSIAFPSISTGIYGYPVPDATHIAIGEVREFLSTHSGALDRVIFVVWSDADKEVYRDLLPLYFSPDETVTGNSPEKSID